MSAMRRLLQRLHRTFCLYPTRQHQPIPSSSQPLLPPELWELVLEELSDESLFIATRVCIAPSMIAALRFTSKEGISRTRNWPQDYSPSPRISFPCCSSRGRLLRSTPSSAGSGPSASSETFAFSENCSSDVMDSRRFRFLLPRERRRGA
ncbi:hypothetical protein DFH07DRAFT_28958 [Mycena maculata]|uniref:Uncharacterized protein n=1 Tax=Mycena maculata TaxID=230809 RepID=A0AAD7IK58_9AGAR|nr:hypothetical protein DFH07DRAFT_28958 [Mycena maculata]